jgi:3-oxoacyl-[acyl-carrier protein] reductase
MEFPQRTERLLDGKNAVITGCARGIGRQILVAFAQNGANVWACCRTATEEFNSFARDLSATHSVTVTPVCFDLRDQAAMKEQVKAILSTKKSVDVLINNAGITYNALVQMTSLEKLREVFDINFFSPFALIQYLIRPMVRQGSGSIINIGSTAALDANCGRGGYGASKAALICLTRALAHELAEKHIRVNAIAPGVTDTDMVGESMSAVTIQETIAKTRLKRIGKPEDIADAAVFLASDYSSYITGEVLRVDGGLQN